MHPPAKVGQGDQRTTLGSFEVDYDHPPQITTRRPRR
jgi:hypothetical protein